MKTFTLDEAQSLLPVLESLLKRAVEAKQAAEVIQEELQELSRRIFLSGGMHLDPSFVGRRKAALDVQVQRAKDAVAEIDSIGVQVKDLDTGLLDFPASIDGEIVLLCWKMGEARIEHWHTVEAGFRGRQPIDDRFRSPGSERPN